MNLTARLRLLWKPERMSMHIWITVALCASEAVMAKAHTAPVTLNIWLLLALKTAGFPSQSNPSAAVRSERFPFLLHCYIPRCQRVFHMGQRKVLVRCPFLLNKHYKRNLSNVWFISFPTWISSVDALFITEIDLQQFLCPLWTWSVLDTFCKQGDIHLLFIGFDHLNKCASTFSIHLTCFRYF